MSTDRDTTRIVRSWLEEGATALPDRVLDSVLDQVPATRQRRSWWPAWRFAPMNASTKLAIAAAAVVVVAVVGYNLLPNRGGNIGGPPTAAPTSSPTAPPEIRTGALAAGTYTVTSFTATPFTLVVPAGWALDGDGFIAKGDYRRGTGVGFGTWVVDHVYGDSCKAPRNMVPVNTSAELLTAFGQQTGHGTVGPTERPLGGLTATWFEFSVPADFDLTTCDGGIIRLWPGTGGDDNSGEPILAAGQTDTIYVLADGARTTVLVAIQHVGSTEGDVVELRAILNSIEFQR